MEKELLPVDQVTPEIIKGWKEKYGTVAKFKVTEGGKTKTAFVRKPTNKEIDGASMNLTKGAITMFGISLFRSCQLAGDEITSDDALRSVGQQMQELIEQVEVEVEKL